MLRIKALEKERQKQKELRDSLNEKAKSSFKEFNSLKRRRDNINRQISQAKAVRERLEAEYEQLINRAGKLRKNLKKTKNSPNETLEQEYNETQRRIDEVKEELQKIRIDLNGKYKVAHLYHEQVEKHYEKSKEIQNKADIAHNVFVGLSNELKKLRKELKNLS